MTLSLTCDQSETTEVSSNFNHLMFNFCGSFWRLIRYNFGFAKTTWL